MEPLVPNKQYLLTFFIKGIYSCLFEAIIVLH